MRHMRNAFLIAIGFTLIGGATTSAATLTVAGDGSGTYKTVQEAVAAASADSAERTIIHIKPGTYRGPIIVPKEKSKLTFEGEDAATTILTWDHNQNEPAPPGSDKTNPGVQVIADDFRAEQITFQNVSGDHGQAVALYVDGDRGRSSATAGCSAGRTRSTPMTGREYYEDCYIEGRVDFIFGGATAVFDHCEIHSKNGGYVTAARTPQDSRSATSSSTANSPATPPRGTRPAPIPRRLRRARAAEGRTRPSLASIRGVAYINCEMGDHIKPEGWDNWRSRERKDGPICGVQ